MLLFCFIHIAFALSDEIGDLRQDIVVCRDKLMLVGSAFSELYQVVEVHLGESLKLKCKYCKEEPSENSKLWFKQDGTFNSTSQEIAFEQNENASLNRINLEPDNTLIIKNVSLADSGIFLCREYGHQDSFSKLNYFIDVVYSDSKPPETGDLQKWKTYNDDILSTVNLMFQKSTRPDFQLIREIWNLKMEIFTFWGSWSDCSNCGRRSNIGTRRRPGGCRIRNTNTIFPKEPTFNNDNLTDLQTDFDFLYHFEFSCGSIRFGKAFPFIGNITRQIPNFIITERCNGGTCNPDSSNLSIGWNVGKLYKYKKTFVLVEGAHLTLVCPESSMEQEIVWRHNGFHLKVTTNLRLKDGTEPRILLDTFGTLYLQNVTDKEEGNYTCTVDSKKMQQNNIIIVSKSKILQGAFLRHLGYLSFVLVLLFSCYCAGVCLACSNRHEFKKYELLKVENEDSEFVM